MSAARMTIEHAVHTPYMRREAPGPLRMLFKDRFFEGKLRVDMSKIDDRHLINKNRNWLLRLFMVALPRSLAIARMESGEFDKEAYDEQLISALSQSSRNSTRNDNRLSVNQRGEICLRAILVLKAFWDECGQGEVDLLQRMQSEEIERQAGQILLETCKSVCRYEIDPVLAKAMHPDDLEHLVPYSTRRGLNDRRKQARVPSRQNCIGKGNRR